MSFIFLTEQEQVQTQETEQEQSQETEQVQTQETEAEQCVQEETEAEQVAQVKRRRGGQPGRKKGKFLVGLFIIFIGIDFCKNGIFFLIYMLI